MPLASNAVKLARSLRVPADWLFDDSRDWPPPDSIPGIDLSGRTDEEVQAYLLEREARILTTAIDALARHDGKKQLDQTARDELFELAKALHLLALSRFALLTNMQDRALQLTVLEQMILHDVLGLSGPPHRPSMLEAVAPETRDQAAARVAEWNRLQEIERRRVHKMIEERRRLAREHNERIRSSANQATEVKARQRHEAEARQRHEAEARQHQKTHSRQKQRTAAGPPPPRPKPKPGPKEHPADRES